jgi:hypothetical protein
MAYDNESYLVSLANSRGDVDRQVQNTLNEVTRQQQVAQNQVGKIDGAVGSIFDQGRGAVRQDTGNLNSGLGSYLSGVGLGENTSALSALGRQQAAFQAASPLLNQGFSEQATQRSGAVNNIGAQLRADLEAKRNDYIGRRDQEERQKAFDAQQALAAQRAQEALMNRQMEATTRTQAAMLAAQQLEAQRQREFEAQQAAIARTHLASLANPPAARPPERYITRFGQAS